MLGEKVSVKRIVDSTRMQLMQDLRRGYLECLHGMFRSVLGSFHANPRAPLHTDLFPYIILAFTFR